MDSNITIDLQSFLDFCTTSGLARIKVVSRVKKTDPAQLHHDDFYHQMSDALRDMHLNGRNPGVLEAFLHAQTDERRRRIYPQVIEGYRKFLKDQGKVTWLAPPATSLRYGDLHVLVAPELGLFLDGVGHLLALDFAKPQVSPKRRTMHLNIMAKAFVEMLPGATFAMLNVRFAQLHRLKAPNPRMNLLLNAEARAFEAIWSGQ